MAVTLNDIHALLTKFMAESRVQNEELVLKLESILTVKGSAQKTASKKKKTKSKIPDKFVNTMYWWVAMYGADDDSIKGTFTEEDEKKGLENTKKVKDKAVGYDQRRAVGMSIWKGFSKEKKTTELKAMFNNWTTERAKNQAKDVTKDVASEEEKKEEAVTQDDDE